MDDANVIFKNDFGFVFMWKRNTTKHYKKLNIVFDKTTLHFTEPEVLVFNDLINEALNRHINNRCKNDTNKLALVETPLAQVSLVMGYENLIALQNLVEGTLVELNFDLALYNNGINFL